MDIAEELREAHLLEQTVRAEKVELVARLAEEYVLPPEVTRGQLVDELFEEVYPFGGPGAPLISEWALPEIAAMLHMSRRKAKVLIQGSVHLKWQLPELFEKMGRLEIEADRAVQAAYAVADLPPELAREVISRWVPLQARYAWTGAFKKLDEMIAEVDPFRAADEESRLSKRQVRVTAGSGGRGEAAVGYIEATVDVIDAKLFNAALSQIAELLKTVQGDESSLDVRKAKAFGVLSRPAYALALIQQGAKHLPEQEPLVEPVDEFGQPLHGPSERYLPAGCAGHVCGTVDVPLDRLEPRITVDVVIEADAVGAGPTARIDDATFITTQTLGQLLAGKKVRVQPVIDLPRLPDEGQYRPSLAMRRAVLTRWRTEAFPFSTTRSKGLDLDHVQRWLRSRGPGQTALPNLIPLTRTVHRSKTALVWMVTMDEQARAIWTSPLGYRYEVTPYGTEPLTPLRRYCKEGISKLAA